MRIPNTIFDRGLLELCDIHRSMDGEVDKENNTTRILSDIPIQILEPERPDYIHPHAEPMSAPDHIGLILAPLDSIQKEDIIFRITRNSDQFPRLFIINLYVESGVQILELEQTMI